MDHRTLFRAMPGASLALVGLLAAAASSWAGDWPQILGPTRNGHASGEVLSERWPAAGPQSVWTSEVGSGYAGPAVVGDRVVVFHRLKDVERVEALGADTGRSIWKRDFEATYRGGVDPDTGPRCVPLVHAGKVYVFGAAGDLHCVALETGQPIWTRQAYAEFNAPEGYFGAGSTPIVADDKLLVNVGGRNGAGIVAFDLETGKTLWQATDEAASYAAPTRAMLGGRERVVFVTRYNALAIDPAQGEVLFRFPFGQRGPTVNAATPLVFDQHLFVSASYGVGARLARLSGDKAEVVWSEDEVMASQYTTCVEHEGKLYGTHGREDLGVGALRCIDAQTGKVLWSEENFGLAHLILANDKLLILKVDGQLLLARPNPQRFEQLASASLGNSITRALPALSNGRFYYRSKQNDRGAITCLQVGTNNGGK